MQAEIETKIRAAHDSGDLSSAATLALGAYGPEILGYLAALTTNLDDAGEVFSEFTEDLWRGLPEFRWESSFRTWAYVLARHAMHRRARTKRIHLPLSAAPISQIEQQVRERTLAHLRTEVKDRFAELRARLPDDDRTLLILRVDRQMSWDELARVMLSSRRPSSDAIKRKATALRKRFERLKERLRAMAEEEGLISAQD